MNQRRSITKPEFKTKKDIVVDIIREAILSAEYKPGDRLLQDQLAEELNVSPTPVREALRQLEAEGILQYSSHKGVRVVEVGPEDVQEIYLMRGALESLATRLSVPHLTDNDIKQLREIQAQIETLIAKEDLKQLRKLNYDMHMLIYQASGKKEILRFIRNLWTKFPRDSLHVLPGRAAISAAEHEEIIEALAKRDVDLAGHLMQVHIENGAQALFDYWEKLE